MFAHIQLGARDVDRMVRFYDAVLAELDIGRTSHSPEAGFVWSKGGRWPQFVIREPYDGLPASSGNGTQVSFLVESRNAVQRAWDAAIRSGGSDEGRPGLRTRYAPDFFAAYCRDPEGNKLCFVFTDTA